MSDASGERIVGFGLGSFISWLIIAGVCLGFWGCPRYNVYNQEMHGLAELKRAESNRHIAVLEAEAKKEAATSLAAAEVERAKGVAQANKIIGESLHENEAYLRYLWIQGLEHNGNAPTVVYVPTEAGLPILEASRFAQQKPAEKK